MKYAIVYSSRTGNTKCLAEEIRGTLPPEDCLYFGEPDASALDADVLFVGFWTDKGDCDEKILAFLQEVETQKAVSYTHLDVYKRQGLRRYVQGLHWKHGCSDRGAIQFLVD